MRRISTLFPILTILSSVSVMGLSVHTAQAQEAASPSAQSSPPSSTTPVTVRGNVLDDYTRLVFESSSPPSYLAEASGADLTLTFQKPVALKTEGASPAGLARVTGYSAPDSTHVKISFAKGQDVRHFTIGNKIIVDIRGPVAGKGKTTPSKETAEKKPDIKALDPVAEKKPASESGKPAVADAKKPVEQVAEPEKTAEKSPEKPVEKAAVEQHTVQIAATQKIALAAFERAGRFWIVIDQPDYALPLRVEGPNAAKFKPFERVPLQEATAFWTTLPDDLRRYGEGGGLVWKVILSGEDKNVAPIEMKRQFPQSVAGATPQGGSLLWPVPTAPRVIDFEDPVVGDVVKVVVVESSSDVMPKRQTYPEAMVLPATIGLVIVPKVDDLQVTKTPEGIAITRPQGLSISRDEDIMAYTAAAQKSEDVKAEESKTETPAPGAEATAAKAPTVKKIFDFNRWLMGGEKALSDNLQVIMGGIGLKNEEGQTADLMLLGKMELANGHGPEALGYFDLAAQKLPDLASTPEFIAMRGAAYAQSGKFDMAYEDFSQTTLDPFEEIKLWRAYTLAGLEDWDQAGKMLPKDFSLLKDYPADVRDPMVLALAEAALRRGDPDVADQMLSIIKPDEEKLILPYTAALQYLRGEYHRQKNEIAQTKEFWEPLTTGRDDLYRAKAGLALTSLLVSSKEMTPDKAVDKLEGLRYAWRGDELETAIAFRLGQMNIDKGDYLKGLSLLRQASSIEPASEQSQKITKYMSDTFRDLFMTKKLQETSPLDAVTVFEEFSELAPQGEEADKLVRALAERLVEVDLLPRAGNLLSGQLEHLKGLDGAAVAIRLTQIQLLDSKPDKALEALNKAETFLSPLPVDQTAQKRREIALLRAQAYSAQKKPEDAFSALALLNQDKDVLRLRAEIAWHAQRWQDAADALEQAVALEDISLTRPLTPDQADMILNWAVALYLSDNRYVLANLRERYADAMMQTDLAKKFEVVTRPRQNTLLADRETINAIVAEIDLFKDFLDVTAKAPAPAPTAAPPATTPVSPPPAAAPPATTPPADNKS